MCHFAVHIVARMSGSMSASFVRLLVRAGLYLSLEEI